MFPTYSIRNYFINFYFGSSVLLMSKMYYHFIMIVILNSKAGFHMMTAIAGRNAQQSLRLCGNHFLAIVTMTAIIVKPGYMETACLLFQQLSLDYNTSQSGGYHVKSTKLRANCRIGRDRPSVCTSVRPHHRVTNMRWPTLEITLCLIPRFSGPEIA